MSRPVQLLTDGAHAAVHHIRRSHHIGTRLHMRQSGSAQQFQGGVIVHVVSAEHAAVSVRCVLAHAYIRDVIQLRKQTLCFPQGTLHNTVLGIRLASLFVLYRRNSEKHHVSDTCFCDLLQLISHAVHTVAVLSLH